MSTLIVYASKHGTTKKCVDIMKRKINDKVDSINFNEDNKDDIDLQKYESVIIGGSIYMGKIQQEIKDFCENNRDELLAKNTGIFVSSALAKGEEFKDNFAEELLEHSKAADNFGYEFNKGDFNLFEKFILKMVNNEEKEQGIKEDRIDEFVEKMGLRGD